MKMQMARKSMVILIACLMLGAAPATEPASPPSGAVRRVRALTPTFPGRPSSDERAAAIDFARENMPNLYRMWDDSQPGSPRRRWLAGIALQKHRRFQQFSQLNDSPERADALLQRMRAEDEILALVQEHNDATSDRREEVRRRARTKMQQIVQDILQERQQRIERLKQMLEREEQALTNDRARMEEMARDRLDRLFREMKSAAIDGPGDAEQRDESKPPESPDHPR